MIIGDSGSSVALDPSGFLYIGGDTTSSDFPITSGAFQTTNSEGGKAFTAKMNLTQNGSQSLVYSTFLGGTNGSEGEVANGIAVDANGDAYVAGSTSSSDFPTTSNAYQTTQNNGAWAAYLTEFNATGSGLIYSTFLGGSCSNVGDVGYGVALDTNANPYISGSTCSTNFPVSPSNAYQTSLAGTYNGFVTKFALNSNPGISATVTPPPNPNGWNNSSVTVSFTCIPGAAPIQTCSSPVNFTSEGANQTASGTAVDTAENSASTSGVVNIDLTPPVIDITSPTSGATITSPYVTVSGTITDALSGVGSVVCNNVTATLSGSGYSCLVSLGAATNTVTVTGFDVAGNSSTATMNVTVSMGTATSLQVTPSTSTLTVGNTETFMAVDQNGTQRPDATWSVSDTTIATLASDGSGTLTGVAGGQVTLTATLQGQTAQATVTVVAGSSLTAGTVLWSATPVSGYSAQQFIQAVPIPNGPAFFTSETDGNGDFLFRALSANGGQMWQQGAFVPSGDILYGTEADGNGGLLVSSEQYIQNSNTTVLQDVNGITGAQNWQFVEQTAYSGPPAVSPTGAISYVANDPVYQFALLTLDGNTGTQLSIVPIPTSIGPVEYICNGGNVQGSLPSSNIGPIYDDSGNAYVLYVQSTTTSNEDCDDGLVGSTTYSGSVSLLTVAPNGSSSTQVLQTFSGSISTSDNPYTVTCTGSPFPFLDGIITDGQNGILAAWSPEPSDCLNGQAQPLTIADASSQGVRTFQIPMTETTYNDVSSAYPMVLGQGGEAFVTDGGGPNASILYGSTPSLVAFNINSGQVLWTYTASSGDQLSIVAPTSDGGILINDSQSGLIQLNSSGGVTQNLARLAGASPYQMGIPILGTQQGTTMGTWSGINNGQLSVSADQFAMPAKSDFLYQAIGAPQSQSGSTPKVTLTVSLGGSFLAVDKTKGPSGGPPSETDDLDFLPSVNTCSETIGLQDCSTSYSYTWAWNAEIHAVVSDDALNWEVPHQMVIGLAKGQARISGGLQPFEQGIFKASPDEDPHPDYVQQYLGSKDIFWLDAPAFNTKWNGAPVDSGTLVDNFVSYLCSSRRSGVCGSVGWSIKIVVASGSTLNRSQSGSAQGPDWWTPLNF